MNLAAGWGRGSQRRSLAARESAVRIVVAPSERVPSAANGPRAPDQPPSASPVGSSLLTQLKVLLDGRWKLIALLVLGSVLAGLTESALLATVAETASAMVSHASRARITLGPVHINEDLRLVFVFAGIMVVVRLGLLAIVSIVPATIMADIQVRMRADLLRAYMAASWTEQSRDREGQLQELMTNQVAQATNGTMQAAQFLIAVVTFLVLVAAATALNMYVAGLVVASAVGLFALLRPLGALVRRLAAAQSRVGIRCATGISETVRLTEETQVFGTHEPQRQLVMRLVEAIRPIMVRIQTLQQLTPWTYQSAVYLLLVVALAGLYALGGGQVASLGAVVLIMVRAGMYGQQVQSGYQGLLVGLPYVDRIRAAQHRYSSSRRIEGHTSLERVKSLSFERVCYAYDQARPVLIDISFDVASGETIGIVGPTGAGKSTLVQILLGLRPPDAGRYLVNGIPREDFKRHDWNTRVAYMPQQPQVLYASVAENIRFFRDLREEDIERAARLANIHDEITRWPAGYETVIGPRAAAVSGGQQQRICLARALAANPEVLVLDEPTSALDPRTEFLIQDSLAALQRSVTLFIVAHRMSTLDTCDRLVVILDGRLEAMGSVSELRNDSAYYRAVSDLRRLPSATAVTAVE